MPTISPLSGGRGSCCAFTTTSSVVYIWLSTNDGPWHKHTTATYLTGLLPISNTAVFQIDLIKADKSGYFMGCVLFNACD